VQGPAAFTGAIQPPGRTERLGTMMDRMMGVANSPNNAMVGREFAPLSPGWPPASYTPLPAGLIGPIRIRIQAAVP
jgi:hypothetical protein